MRVIIQPRKNYTLPLSYMNFFDCLDLSPKLPIPKTSANKYSSFWLLLNWLFQLFFHQTISPPLTFLIGSFLHFLASHNLFQALCSLVILYEVCDYCLHICLPHFPFSETGAMPVCIQVCSWHSLPNVP